MIEKNILEEEREKDIKEERGDQEGEGLGAENKEESDSGFFDPFLNEFLSPV